MTAGERLPVDLAAFRSALIVKPSSLGDIVHTLPAVRLLKLAHPDLLIRWIANTEWAPILRGSPFVDEVIPFPRNSFRGLRGLWRFARWAAGRNRDERQAPEIVLDFQGLLRSGIVSFARGADCVVGLSNSREGASKFCDHIVALEASAHAVDQNLAMIRALGVRFSPEDVQFPLPDGEPFDFASRTGAAGDTEHSAPGISLPPRFLLLHPWSRGEGKSLSFAVLQAFCDSARELPVIIVGRHTSPPAITGAHVMDLTNKTSLAQLLSVMRRAAACISVDSGPMHIAAAVNPRTLGIHTWSDPRKVGPYPASAWVWKAGRIAHRSELAPGECLLATAVTEADARAMADFVLRVMLHA